MKREFEALLYLLLVYAFLFGPIKIYFNRFNSADLTAIGTIGAVFVALAIAIFGKTLSELFYKSDLRIIEPFENEQIEGHIVTGQTRLLIRNDGNSTSRDVEVYVNRLYYNGHARRNYLPVPLYWTHNGPKRNFHPKQFGYLDLCRRNDINNPNVIPKLVLAAGANVPTYEDIYPGKTELELIFFQESGQVKKYKIYVEWRTTLSCAHVADWKEII